MLLFYTGAEEDKPTYRRGILDTLSYPAGQVIEYSYRLKNVQASLWQSSPSVTPDLSGQAAVIVFVDVDSQGSPTYMPLRLAEVVRHSPFAGARDRDRIDFTLRLGDFVQYGGDTPDRRSWHEELAGFDEHRKENGHLRFFVIAAEFAPASSGGRPGWEVVAMAVAQSSKLAAAILINFELKNVDDRSPLKLRSVGERQVYQLRPGTVYQLDLCVYQKPPRPGFWPPSRVTQIRGAAREAKITLTRSSELLDVGQPFQSAVSGLAEHSALVSCKRTIERNLVALGVTVEEPVPNVVNTPHPFFLLRISLPWTVTAFFCALVFTGSFFVAVDLDTVKGLLERGPTWLSAQAPLASVASKWLGATLLAIAAFLGFRKLPSGP